MPTRVLESTTRQVLPAIAEGRSYSAAYSACAGDCYYIAKNRLAEYILGQNVLSQRAQRGKNLRGATIAGRSRSNRGTHAVHCPCAIQAESTNDPNRASLTL